MRSDRRDSSGASARLALAAGAAVVGFAVTLAVFYPGLLSQDSVMQLEEGRRGTYDVWHPPLMAWLLGRFDAVLPGTGGLCLLHAALLWGAIAGIALASFRGRYGPAIATLAIGLAPPVFALSGLIWKDTGMGAAMLLAASLLLHAERNDRIGLLLVAVAALAYATALRHNAVIAAFPLCLWAGAIATRLPYLRALPSLLAGPAIGGLLCAALVANLQWIERRLIEKPGPPPVQQILIHDIAAASLAEGRMLLPAVTVARAGGLTLEELRPLVKPTDIGPLFWGEGKRLPLVSDPAEMAEIVDAWRQVVRQHPSAYLAHRLDVFAWLIGRCGACDTLPDVETVPQDPPLWPKLGSFVRERISSLGEAGVFRGWIFVGLCAVLAPIVSLDRSRRSAALAVGASGIGYAAFYVFIGTGCSYRFLWWTALASAALLCLAVSVVLERRAP